MAAQEKPPFRPSVLIDVESVFSVGRDRPTGQPVLRFVDTEGCLITVRLPRAQLRTLANGEMGLAEALEDEER